MKKILLLVLAIILLAAACNKKPEEPSGTPVVLTSEDTSMVNWADDNAKTWAAWQGKGVRLVNEGKYEEALYCFHQALATYPEELSDKAPESSKKTWKEVPTDTYLQLGYLYQKINRPDLALYYFEEFEKYFPNDKYVTDEIKKLRQK